VRYLRIEIDEPSGAPSWGGKLVLAALKALLPAANPDVEKLHDRVRVWWLEIEDTGEPVREIGFDAAGEPIVLGPVGANVGLLGDASDDWSDSDAESAEAGANFDKVWERMFPAFAHLETTA
jgi:hypothetical protein